MQPIKWYNLTKGDRVRHGDKILTFNKMDGAYPQFISSEGTIYIGSYDSYELGEDGIYVPTTDIE